MASSRKDPKPRLKLVVRCLPPQLTEANFRTSIEKFNELISDYYFVPGRVSEKKSTNARAYLGFTSPEGLNQFFQFFNGHVFVTNKGREQKAIVEYAPSQKLPKKATKSDPREGTIETDEDFLKFLEELKTPVVQLPSAEEQLDKRLADKEANQMPTTTPLLEFLREKRAHKEKQREERAERRKRNSNNKEKKESTSKRTSGDGTKKEKTSRRRDREDKKKKKRDPIEKKEGEPGDEKKGKNGIWQIRKQTEPGTVAIQTRDPSDSEEHMESESHSTNTGAPSQPGQPSNPKPPRRTQPRRGRSNKPYTPKPTPSTPLNLNAP
eukprot:TRINITY_DN1141_c0_g1_i1.p1 TRINITY_DN1141_c0_g1~~TRINITY_DN1141_c0_g1_i1.p1  ORF type:complete len:323 (-),score=94.19 TRINITY_DN1141_c0_g1_i1:263-1231(-)